MASTQFITRTIDLSATGTGTMSQNGNSVRFSTNVLNASAAIQAWDVQFDSGGRQYHTKRVAAEISNVTYSSGSSPNVSFDVRLVLEEIAPQHYNVKGSITVLVIAYCE